MNAGFKFVMALLVMAYPLLIYYFLPQFSPRILALVLILILGLRWLSQPLATRTSSARAWFIPLAIGALVAALALVLDSALLLKLYPAFISFSFLALFTWSLAHPPTLIERIAARHDPLFGPEQIPYVRKVMRVWCAFFIVNGSIAVVTVWLGDERLWALYNGLISYLLIGLLFAGEYAVRRYCQRRERRKLSAELVR